MRFGRILGIMAIATALTIGSSHAQADAVTALPALPWQTARAYASGESRDVASVIRAAEAELVMGRAARAIEILTENPIADTLFGGTALTTYAHALFELGDFRGAAMRFSRAAALTGGASAGVLLARAGDAYERGDVLTAAVSSYEDAARRLPAISGWLALRQARAHGDTASARQLLLRAPRHARRLANVVWAQLSKTAGDTLSAITALVDAGDVAEAAELSLAIGDSGVARRLTYQGLRSSSRPLRSHAAELARDRLPPQTVAEERLLARALRNTGHARDAAALLSTIVADGDSSATTLYEYGRATAASGDRWRSLGIYQAAANMGGEKAVEAQFSRAQLLVSMKRRNDALAALRVFVVDQPAHRHTPLAFFLIGDLEQDIGRAVVADSLYHIVVRTWPRSETAGRARLRLGSNALQRGDTAAAIVQYNNASVNHGEEARSSRYQLGILHMARGDTSAAFDAWRRLAREDSLGYYGTIARVAAGLPAPVFTEPTRPLPAPRIQRELGALDLLDAANMHEEAAALISGLIANDSFTVAELLDLGEGFISRGRTIQGIRLGWRLAQSLTTNHPRVVRLIFPWPNRDLVEREADRFDLDPVLVAALIRQESAFDAGIVSRAGATGLMQLMPSTARGVARQLGVEWNNDLLVVAGTNVHVGTAHLASLMRQYDGDVIPSLAAYNAGGRPVARWLRFPEAEDPVRFVERIPYRETRGYVKAVLRNRHLYAALYGNKILP